MNERTNENALWHNKTSTRSNVKDVNFLLCIFHPLLYFCVTGLSDIQCNKQCFYNQSSYIISVTCNSNMVNYKAWRDRNCVILLGVNAGFPLKNNKNGYKLCAVQVLLLKLD